jgi:hypothetical protein
MLMKRAVLCIAGVLYCIVSLGQTRFNLRYNLDHNDIGQGIQEAINNYIISSTTFDNDSNIVRVQTMTIDSLGNPLSNHSFYKLYYYYYGSWSGGFCKINSTEFAQAGTIIDSSNNYDAVIYKFNLLGDTIWLNQQHDTVLTIGRSIKYLSDGGFILVGQMNLMSNSLDDIVLRKTDSVGNIEWQRQFDQSWYDDAFSIIQAHDKGFLIGGISIPTNSTFADGLIIKTDSMGNENWRRIVGNQYDQGVLDVVETQDSNYVVTGTWQTYDHLPHCCESFGYRFFLMKLDKDSGNVIWMKLYDDSLSDKGLRSVIELNDGSLVCAGLRGTTSNPTFGTIFKFSANGDSLWERNYLPPFVVTGHGFLNDIIATSDGGFIAVGEAGGDTLTQDTWILKVDSMGCEVSNCLTTDLQEHNFQEVELLAYPNPVNGNQIHLQYNEALKQETSLQIFSATGEIIFQKQIQKGLLNEQIDLNRYEDGLYLVRIIGVDFLLQTKFVLFRN